MGYCYAHARTYVPTARPGPTLYIYIFIFIYINLLSREAAADGRVCSDDVIAS